MATAFTMGGPPGGPVRLARHHGPDSDAGDRAHIAVLAAAEGEGRSTLSRPPSQLGVGIVLWDDVRMGTLFVASGKH